MSEKKVIRIRSPHTGLGFRENQIAALKVVDGVQEVVYNRGALTLLVIPEDGVDENELRAKLLDVL